MWNNVNTLSREHQMLEMYYKHQNVIKNIRSKKGCMYSDDHEPIRPLFLQGDVKSKKMKVRREMEVETENRCLFDRMQQITSKPGVLNPILIKKQQYVKGSLNLDSRVQSMRNIMNQNQSMENRIDNVRNDISNTRLQKEYRANNSYIKNITKNSRRIVNCFLDQNKKQRYANGSSMNKLYKSHQRLNKFEQDVIDQQEKQKQQEQQQQQEQEQQRQKQKEEEEERKRQQKQKEEEEERKRQQKQKEEEEEERKRQQKQKEEEEEKKRQQQQEEEEEKKKQQEQKDDELKQDQKEGTFLTNQ